MPLKCADFLKIFSLLIPRISKFSCAFQEFFLHIIDCVNLRACNCNRLTFASQGGKNSEALAAIEDSDVGSSFALSPTLIPAAAVVVVVIPVATVVAAAIVCCTGPPSGKSASSSSEIGLTALEANPSSAKLSGPSNEYFLLSRIRYIAFPDPIGVGVGVCVDVD